MACQAILDHPNAGLDLLRLHKRATVKLHITVHTAANTDESTRLSILLSYARAYSIMGEKDEARKKYQDIQLFRVAEQDALLYLAIAKFEADDSNVSAAKEALQSGIQKGAQPVKLLQDELDRLTATQKRSVALVIPPLRTGMSSSVALPGGSSGGHLRSTTNASENATLPGAKSAMIEPTYSTPDVSRSRIAAATTSRKARSTPRTFFETPTMDGEEAVPPVPSGIIETVGQENRSILPCLTPARDQQSSDTNNEHVASDNTSGTSGDSGNESEKTPSVNSTVKNNRPSNAIKSDLSSISRLPQKSAVKKSVMFAECTKQPPLSTLTSSLTHSLRTRKRNIGGALRVLAEAPRYNSDEDENVDGTYSSSSTEEGAQENVEDIPMKKAVVVPSRTVKKITRTELSYMLNWDPETYRKRRLADTSSLSDTNQTGKTEEGRHNGTCESTLSTIKQGHEHHQDNVKTTGSSHSENNLVHRTPTPSPEKKISRQTDAKKPINRHSEPSPAESLSSADISTTKLNPDFIGLASEENMLRVNGLSYAKLGVIGKGGSCKVYRALSKDCLVLAIKKVKLEGKEKGSLVDTRTIEMYKNEIALLNSLSGNPSIIRMFDSEVDLNRKVRTLFC